MKDGNFGGYLRFNEGSNLFFINPGGVIQSRDAEKVAYPESSNCFFLQIIQHGNQG
jgi:hypothetical protein